MWLNRFTKVVAGSSLLLLVAGALVSSTGSGMSIPEWPRSSMAAPDGSWAAGAFYQYSHRLAAATVALMTVLLAAAYSRMEHRRWVRRLALVAFATIAAQAFVGGVDVLRGLPALVSTLHSGLAQIFFALLVALVVVTSNKWRSAEERDTGGDAVLRNMATFATVIVFAQIVLGAAMRHIEATHAIPDYPLAFGRLIPDLGNWEIAVHFAHRIGAVFVTGALVAVVLRVVLVHRERLDLLLPAALMVVLLAAEIILGAFAVVTSNVVAISVSLVVAGALLLATTVVLALRTHQPFLANRRAAPIGGRR